MYILFLLVVCINVVYVVVLCACVFSVLSVRACFVCADFTCCSKLVLCVLCLCRFAWSPFVNCVACVCVCVCVVWCYFLMRLFSLRCLFIVVFVVAFCCADVVLSFASGCCWVLAVSCVFLLLCVYVSIVFGFVF